VLKNAAEVSEIIALEGFVDDCSLSCERNCGRVVRLFATGFETDLNSLTVYSAEYGYMDLFSAEKDEGSEEVEKHLTSVTPIPVQVDWRCNVIFLTYTGLRI